MEKKMKYLGYANGWDKTPECVICSREAKQEIRKVKIGDCLYEYICEEGGWMYRVDCSD